jgi:hypothetical protein
MQQTSANMYSDAPDDAPAKSAPSGEGPDQQSALIPKALFDGDVKPGDKITLTAVSVDEDEVVCEKAGDDQGHEDGGEPAAEAPEQEAPGGMSSMLSD